MKTVLLAAALAGATLLPRMAAAQTVFAPAGAEWWYQVTTVGGPYVLRVYAAGDTVLPGHSGVWRSLKSQYYGYDRNGGYFPTPDINLRAFTQVRGSQVWAVHVRGTTEQRILDFDARPGSLDTITYCQGSFQYDTAVVNIDSVSSQVWGGAQVRVQWHSTIPWLPTSPVRQFTGMVAERRGHPYAILLPVEGCGTDPDYPDLVYYVDNEGSFGQQPRIVSGVTETAATRVLQIAPNPSASGRFRLEGLTTEGVAYIVVDAQGRRVSSGQLTAADAEISLRSIPAGLYLLRGEVGKRVFTRRLVRQ